MSVSPNPAMIDDDLFSSRAIADPHEYFGRIREADPVHWNARHRSWIVTRYAHVLEALKDSRLSNATIDALRDLDPPAVYELLSRWMPFNDPPTHTRLRHLAHTAFTPRRVEALRESVRRFVSRLLDGMDRRRTDFMRDLAVPLPATVIAELLGVRPEDRETFKRWSTDLGALVFSSLGDPARYTKATEALLALENYLSVTIERYRKEPADNLITALVRAECEGDLLDEKELVAMCILLLFAGHETTTSQLSNTLYTLLRHPTEFRLLREEPSLIGSAVEECLRYEGTAKIVVRLAAVDLEIGNRQLRMGDRVLLVLSAANRDPRRFSNPDALDIRRDNNRHLGFGQGIHFCLGSPLARLELEVAIPMILKRFPHIELARDELHWQPSLLVRSPLSFPVSLQPDG